MRNIVKTYCFVGNIVKLFESGRKVGRKKMLATTDYIVLALMKNQKGSLNFSVNLLSF